MERLQTITDRLYEHEQLKSQPVQQAPQRLNEPKEKTRLFNALSNPLWGQMPAIKGEEKQNTRAKIKYVALSCNMLSAPSSVAQVDNEEDEEIYFMSKGANHAKAFASHHVAGSGRISRHPPVNKTA